MTLPIFPGFISLTRKQKSYKCKVGLCLHSFCNTVRQHVPGYKTMKQ